MSTIKKFKCIFCSETFDDKESLQVHFRKHGDRNQHEQIKLTKKRPQLIQNDNLNIGNKDLSSNQISCDVCTEQFTTIAKAISHKHKFHPDHHVKHFCPWCGKLFPIKHLLDKHQDSHKSDEHTGNFLPCDLCQFNFIKPKAMNYHNKFFHRMDVIEGESQHGGTLVSTKLCKVNNEMIPLYYCPSCGEEFYNKVNLHNHVNLCKEIPLPEEVIKCGLCSAIFYHLEGFEGHLAYHSTDDIYATEETNPSKTMKEFTVKTVPYTKEKTDMPFDAEMDFDKFLEIGLGVPDASTTNKAQQGNNNTNPVTEASNDQSEDETNEEPTQSNDQEERKAITIDEFFSMNKDVFGEILDFQGVEEIPQRVIANQLKRRPKKVAVKNTPAKVISASNLKRLKQQGVVIQVKKGAKAMTTINKLKPVPLVGSRPVNLKQITNIKNLTPVPKHIMRKVLPAHGTQPGMAVRKQMNPNQNQPNTSMIKNLESVADSAPSGKESSDEASQSELMSKQSETDQESVSQMQKATTQITMSQNSNSSSQIQISPSMKPGPLSKKLAMAQKLHADMNNDSSQDSLTAKVSEEITLKKVPQGIKIQKLNQVTNQAPLDQKLVGRPGLTQSAPNLPLKIAPPLRQPTSNLQQVRGSTIIRTANTPSQLRPLQGLRPMQMRSPGLRPVGVRPQTSQNIRPTLRPVHHVPNQVKVLPGTSAPLRPTVVNQQFRPRQPTSTPIRQMQTNSNQDKPGLGKPGKVLPAAVKTPAKVATSQKQDDTDKPGYFSCFKKPKESLIPISEDPALSSNTETTVSVQPNTNTVNSVVAKSSVNNPNTEAAKAALKHKSTSSHLEALEKLKKQGLLVKKPKLDKDDEVSSSSNSQFLSVKGGG